MPRWKPKTLEDRFWQRVQKTDGCWLWTGGRQSAGYGALWGEGTVRGAHRISWELHFGSIPAGLSVLHHCDNPSCVRPDHLFLGTDADNVADMYQKGRAVNAQPKGEAHGSAKLTEADIVSIRIARDIGMPLQMLATAFGVDQATISKIARRQTWRHVADPQEL